MRRFVIFSVALCMLSALGAGVWWYEYTGTPEYSLSQLVKAVRAKDYESARYYVDEERISESACQVAVQTAVQNAMKQIESDQNPFSGLGFAMMEAMVPRLKEQCEEQARESLRSALGADDSLASGDDNRPFSDKKFKSVRIEKTAVSGNTADVVLDGIPQPNPLGLKTFRLRMARIPNARRWRVVELPDFGAAFAKLLKMQQN